MKDEFKSCIGPVLSKIPLPPNLPHCKQTGKKMRETFTGLDVKCLLTTWPYQYTCLNGCKTGRCGWSPSGTRLVGSCVTLFGHYACDKSKHEVCHNPDGPFPECEPFAVTKVGDLATGQEPITVRAGGGSGDPDPNTQQPEEMGDIAVWFTGHGVPPFRMSWGQNGYGEWACDESRNQGSIGGCMNIWYGPCWDTLVMNGGGPPGPLTKADIPNMACNLFGRGDIFHSQLKLTDANGVSTLPFCFTWQCGSWDLSACMDDPSAGTACPCWNTEHINPTTPCYCVPGGFDNPSQCADSANKGFGGAWPPFGP
jgi:hypothetical protein